MTDEITRIPIKEFRETGYLQEVNRQFLHPLGLALEVVQDEDGTERLGGIWDYRDDPEGMLFGPELDLDKIARVRQAGARLRVARGKLFGEDTIVQPPEWEMVTFEQGEKLTLLDDLGNGQQSVEVEISQLDFQRALRVVPGTEPGGVPVEYDFELIGGIATHASLRTARFMGLRRADGTLV